MARQRQEQIEERLLRVARLDAMGRLSAGIAHDFNMEALSVFHAASSGIDVLVTDVLMPRLDDPALVERLGTDLEGVPTIIMSGHAMGGHLEAIGQLRCEFLPKPFAISHLLAAIERQQQVFAVPAPHGRESAGAALSRR